MNASAGPGVIIASIVGNGGKGGNGYLGATGKAGGTAGRGGTVNVTVKGNSAGDKVVTTGNDGHGVIVQSRAGVGGKGGTGYASDSGEAQKAELTRVGNSYTDGDQSNALVVQSIGGGGGSGGFNVTGAFSASGAGSGAVAVGLGGSGGSAGNAGVAKLDVTGITQTAGDSSTAITAQSIGGGGGGAGGFNVTGTIGVSGTASGAVAVGLGGSGGSCSDADVVDLKIAGGFDENGSQIAALTAGAGSGAILAQSIGGGGGDSTAISISADRNSGGNSGEETGSGDGKSDKAKETPTKNSIQVSIGLDGGEGATGGHVSVATKADMEIDTVGDDARGIHAQSIGGGGGAGGGAANSITNSALALSIAVGGQGGIGATAGRVDVANLANIATRGDGADAIFAQSIGGGGGVGGSAESQISYEVPKSVKDDKEKPDPKAKDQEKTADAKVAETGMGLSLALGGSGGSGAASDGVSVSNAGIISTLGDRSFGIRAQSIGGGGGVAGATSATLTQGERSSNTLQLAIGGSGGDGAAAGAVTVENTGLIFTGGDFSSAISAQSIGGGGGDAAAVTIEESGVEGDDGPSTPGDGGDAPENGAKDAVITTRSVNLAVGGSGGEGGVGGDIIVRNLQAEGVENSGVLNTEGMDAHGILAQSIGGGGGNSSIVQISHDLEASDTSFALNLALGGSGGSGNKAGNILIENDGLIQTSGDGAHGIFAQSIGGGGGNASVAMAVNAALGSGESSSSGSPYFLAVGGSGGTGGDGGSVTVNNSGSIVTQGRDAHGIFAQSIGGGGGNADLAMTVTDNAANLLLANALSAVLGGTGGAGGLAGPVVVNHTGDIYVAGEGSRAIKAESINGGGGSIRIDLDQLLGVALDLAKDKIEGAEAGEKILGYVNKGLDYLDGGDGFAANSSAENRAVVSARAGAIGAENNSAGNVTVNSTGRIFVLGDHSIGSSVQAIGGGGGNIVLHASVGAAALEDSEAGRFAAAFAANDDDLDSGEVPSLSSVDNLGGVAPLSFLQELGGIDGIGNHGGDISNSHDDDMLVQGDHSLGILDQSIGGGGTTAEHIAIPEGALVDRVDLIIGAINSMNETGGIVDRTQDGVVATDGVFSHGVLLQSIGGGGGFGTISLSGEDAQLHNTYVQMGLQGGTGAHAGAVTGVFNGGIATSGDYSTALIAQSIGGGGGAANISGSGEIDVSLGARDGASSNASTVNISIDGPVFTDGTASHGIFLQSIGGGGGLIISDSDQMLLDLSADNEGDSGDIRLTHKGMVDVRGDRSFGVVAQSLGGGGGWVDGKFAGSAGGQGMGGAIELNLENQILATGTDSTAIFAQSEGGTGADDIIINLAELARGGSGSGAGVWIEGGKDNLVTNYQSLSAVSGLAALGGDGNDHISNEGFIIGNIQLGGGDNRLMNNRGATMIAFQTIDLGGTGGGLDGGNANSLVNDGQFLMGLDAPAWPLDLHNGETFGNLDLEGEPRANLLFGARVINHVELNGNFIQTSNGHMAFDVAFGAQPSDHVHVTGDAWVDGTAKVTLTALADAKPITLFATDGIGRDSGLEVADTLALDYSILADQAGIHLTYESDFGQHFLRPNQRAVGKHMDSALDVGDSEGIGRLMAALGNLMSDQQDVYQSIFDELNPEGLVAPLHAQFMNASSFGDNIFGCEERGDEDCVFVGGRIVDYRRTGDRDYLRVTSSGFSTHIGMERALSEDWSLSGAFGYDKIEDLKVDYSRVQTSGEGVNFGFGARGEVGKLDLALNISGGWSWYSSKRATSIFDETEALSNPKTGYLRSSVEVAHSANVGGWRFKPALKLSATKLNFAGMMEYGAGDIGYVAKKHGQSFVSFQPNITVAYEEKGSGLGFRTNVGAVVHSKSQLTLPVRFIGSNGSSDAAMLATPLDKHSLTTSNFLYYKAGGLSFGLDYEAEIGAHSRIQRYGARIN